MWIWTRKDKNRESLIEDDLEKSESEESDSDFNDETEFD